MRHRQSEVRYMDLGQHSISSGERTGNERLIYFAGAMNGAFKTNTIFVRRWLAGPTFPIGLAGLTEELGQ